MSKILENDCNLCGDRPAELKLTLRSLKTEEKLDAIDICRSCLVRFGEKLELQDKEKKGF